MLIYKLLGDSAQQEFARSWDVSYGMNAVTEWKARIAAGGQLHCAMRSRASPPPVRNLAGHCDGGAEGRNHPGHPGAPVPDAQQRLAGRRCALLRKALPTFGAHVPPPCLQHIDYLSIHAQMAAEHHAHLGFSGHIRVFFRHTRRLDA